MVALGPSRRSELSTLLSQPQPAAHNRGMPFDTPAPDFGQSLVPNSVGRFLTLADTAEVLNISVSQSYALVRSGELPAIKIGGQGHWRIERDVLEGYIAGKYEENRRRNLWHQADYADIPELFADREQ
jgi:excisionase family DNA binding protein